MTHYYVSVVDGPRRALLAGPYPTHQEALDQVDAVRKRAIAAYQWAHFSWFGTASSPDARMTRWGAMPQHRVAD